jgi:hypothetical protein
MNHGSERRFKIVCVDQGRRAQEGEEEQRPGKQEFQVHTKMAFHHGIDRPMEAVSAPRAYGFWSAGSSGDGPAQQRRPMHQQDSGVCGPDVAVKPYSVIPCGGDGGREVAGASQGVGDDPGACSGAEQILAARQAA